MNKIIKTLAVAALAALTVAGSAMAAPKGNVPPRGRNVTIVNLGSNAPKGHKAAPKAPRTPMPPKVAPKAPRHEVAGRGHRGSHEMRHGQHASHHGKPHHNHNHHHNHKGTLHTEDWCTIGASLVGGILGGIVGSSL